MSYLLRAHLIQRIAESGPVNRVTGFNTPTKEPVLLEHRDIEEWDGTINTVTVHSPNHDFYRGRTVIEYADGTRYTVTKTYLDSITVTTTEQ